MKRVMVVAAAVVLAACQRRDVKVLIGATTVTGAGAAPIEDSVVVVAGRTVRSVGVRKDVPIPQDSARTDVTGKWIVPADGARIAAGEAADLIVLDHAPRGGDGGRRMVNGEWVAGQ
jgi:hypothetical protein